MQVKGNIDSNPKNDQLFQKAMDINKNTDYLNKLTDFAPYGIYIYNLDEGKNTYVNYQVAELFECKIEDILVSGKQFYEEHLHPKDRLLFYRIPERLRTSKEGEVQQYDYRMKTFKGNWKWIRSRVSIFSRNDNGSPRELLGSCADITIDKITREELIMSRENGQEFSSKIYHQSGESPLQIKKKESIFQSMINATHDLSVLVDRSGKILASNQRLADAWGMTVEGLIGKIAFRYLAASTVDTHMAKLEECFQTGKPISYYVLTAAGTDLAMEFYPIDNEEGVTCWVAGFAQDITELNKTIKDLKESQAMMTALLDSSPDVSFIMTADGKLLAINETASQKFGVPKEELIGQDIFKYFSPETVDGRRRILKWVLQDKKPITFEDRSGNSYLSNTIHPILNAEGNVEKVAFHSRDITEHQNNK